jgi:chemotaxis protein MotA
MRRQQIMREMRLEGVASILEGMNPHMLEAKLLGFMVEEDQTPQEEAGEDEQ